MKPASDELIALLQTNNFLMTELYQFTSLSGVEDYFTALDMPILYNGNIYKANALRVEGLKYKVAVGLTVDEQDVKISAYPGETIFGSDFLPAVAEGALDAAYLTRSRGFWQRTTGIAALDFTYAPIGVVTLFTGRISTVTKLGRTYAEIKVKSPLVLLDIDMPRNTYGPACQWELFNSGCTLDRASFTQSYTVGSSTDSVITPTVPLAFNTGADGLPYYQSGRITFTSGVNNGLVVSVSTNDAATFSIRFPLLIIPRPGDTFNASAGCSKFGKGGACELKFNNLPNFRGFSRVPPVAFSV